MTRSLSRWSLSLTGVLLLAGVPRVVAQDRDLARLFPRELDVTVPAGPARLAIPADVLATARPDLADVRLFSARGDQFPYLVDSGARPVPTTATPAPTPALPLSATRHATGGYVTETFDLAPPPTTAAHYELSLTTPAADFVRDLRISVVGADGVVLATPLVDTTIFRFQTPLRERLRFALPPVPEGARALRVVVAGQGTGLGWGNFYGALEPVFVYEPTLTPVDPPTLSIALSLRATRHAQGTTTLDLALPLGLRPDRVRLATSTPNFVRGVTVSDDQRVIGGGDVFRVEALRARGGEWLEVPIERASGDRLTVTIDDGDSPALAAVQFVAIVRQPSLVFFADGDPVTLRYGGGRARAPRYDLESLGRVGLAGSLLLGDALHDATPSAPRANSLFDAAPALAFLGRPGVVVDARRYTHVASIVVPEAREGISLVRVPAAAMSVARADLGDLRIVGADGKQWPYVEATGERPTVDLPLEIGAPVREGRQTRYTLRLPVTSAFVSALRLDVDARFTERAFTLLGVDDDGAEVELMNGYLARGPEEHGPIVRVAGGMRAQDLVLAVQDGDDAPLVFRSAVVVARVAELELAAPAGTYRLLIGNAAAEAPHYELARAQSLIGAVPLGVAEPGRVSKNAAYHEPGLLERTGWQAIALWIALGLAVLVLGGLTLRLARMESDEPAPAPLPCAPAAPTVAQPAAEPAAKTAEGPTPPE